MSIENKVAEYSKKAIEVLYGVAVEEKDIQIQATRKEFEGDVTLVVFPFVKLARKSPEQVSLEIGAYLKQEIDLVQDFNAVKGFLNLRDLRAAISFYRHT